MKLPPCKNLEVFNHKLKMNYMIMKIDVNNSEVPYTNSIKLNVFPIKIVKIISHKPTISKAKKTNMIQTKHNIK